MCVCWAHSHSFDNTDCGVNVAVRGPQAQPLLHTIRSVKAFLREKVYSVVFWTMYHSGKAACRCPEDVSSSPR